jgi:HrpA-like RNA helicase
MSLTEVSVEWLSKGIIEKLNGEPIGIIAPTGIGKSTTMISTLQKSNKIVFVSEPTIISCENLKYFMSSSFGYTDDDIGIAAESEVRYKNVFLSKLNYYNTVVTSNTPIVYCTSGHLANIFFRLIEYANKDLTFCDVIVVDEVHNGSLDNSIILYLYFYLYNLKYKLPQLIISSATLIPAEFNFKFNFYEIKGSKYPVEIIYNDEYFDSNDRNLYINLGEIIVKKHKQEKIENNNTWLVFCPGSYEIDLVASRLENVDNLEVIKFTSKTMKEDRKKIRSPVDKNTRRIIIATNVVESSITIDNLSGVFDTLTEKYTVTSVNGGLNLITMNVSKLSQKQRIGRVGRTQKGFYYSMMPKKEFDNLPESRPNELSRIPIYTTILKFLKANLDPEILKEVKTDKIKDSIKLLKELNMIDSSYKVTEKGSYVSHIPLSIKNSSILYEWIKSKQPIFQGVVILSFINSYTSSYFYYLKDINKKQYFDKYFKQYMGKNDIYTLSNLWNTLLPSYKEYLSNKTKLYAFCKEHSLYFNNVKKLFTTIKTTLSSLQVKYNLELIDENIIPKLIDLFKDAYKDNIYIKQEYVKYLSPTYVNINKDSLTWELETSPTKVITYNKPPIYPMQIINLIGITINNVNKIIVFIPLNLVVIKKQQEITPKIPMILPSLDHNLKIVKIPFMYNIPIEQSKFKLPSSMENMDLPKLPGDFILYDKIEIPSLTVPFDDVTTINPNELTKLKEDTEDVKNLDEGSDDEGKNVDMAANGKGVTLEEIKQLPVKYSDPSELYEEDEEEKEGLIGNTL